MPPSIFARLCLPDFSSSASGPRVLLVSLFALATLPSLAACKSKPKAQSSVGHEAKDNQNEDKDLAKTEKNLGQDTSKGPEKKPSEKHNPAPLPKDRAKDKANAEPGGGSGADTKGANSAAAKEPAPDPNPANKQADKAEGDTQAKETPKTSNKTLLARIARSKYSDDKARAWLKQAEDNGAKVRELALAANKRGEALFSEADRADAFFQWAQDKDPTLPLPSFNRAKLAALRGDIPGVRTHLKTVKDRGGKKLLRKVGFDPTFSLVHDDPVVRSMTR